MKEFLKETLGEEWFNILEKEFDLPYFQGMANQLSNERSKKMVYPDQDSVFRAFRETPFSKVKVILLGQDPYNSLGEATGVAFDHGPAYNKGGIHRISPSWAKVLEEYDKEFKSNFATDLMDGDLTRWCHIGVLLINSALTVPHRQPGAHQKIWEPFIAKVLDILAWDARPKVFVFLGNDAKKFSHIVRQPHLAFGYEHPAAACYAIPGRPWNADGIFRTINAALEQQGNDPIEW